MFITFPQPIRVRLAAFSLGLLAATAAVGQTVLPSLPGRATFPLAINNNGVIVGYSYDAKLFNDTQAVRWVDRKIMPLGGFTESVPTGINDAGVIVGAGFDVGLPPQPVIWIDGAPSTLPTLGNGGYAQDINAAGDIVGWVYSDIGTLPAVWRGGVLTVLPTLRGMGGEATAIDQEGKIVGVSRSLEGDQIPTQWSNDQAAALPVSFGESYGGVIGVGKTGGGRSSGYVLQSRTLENGSLVYFIVAVGWQDGGYRELQRLSDEGSSYAYDVTANGVYVGYTTDPDGYRVPAIWTENGVSRLPFAPGREALAIGANDKAQVVGVDYQDVFNPVPLIWDLAGQPQIAMASRVASGGQTVSLDATVLRKGIGVPGQAVRFEADGKLVGKAITDAKGVAKLPYTVPASASDSIRLKVSTTGSSYAVRQVEILRASTAAGVTPVSGVRGSSTTLRASLRSAEINRPLAGREVTFVLDGVTVGKARTNERGLAFLRYAVPINAATGTRQLAARYAGDSSTAPTEARATLAVLR